MSGRYERVNAQDSEDTHHSAHHSQTPNSPPPSFHSRASSIATTNTPRNRSVNDPTLADAFDGDDSEDDGESDDRQRLVRQNSDLNAAAGTMSPPSGSSAPFTPASSTPSLEAMRTTPTNPNRVYGGGIENGGVFTNLTAKPERKTGPEKEEMPPTYEQAAADAAPPYWETTILAPGLGGPDEVYIDGMPVGSLFSFVWNGIISMSFQLVGFLLTYLLHSTHAAKNGSRAGLGMTLIQFGFYMKGNNGGTGGGMGGDGTMPGDGYTAPPDPNSHDFDPGTVTTGGGSSGGDGGSVGDSLSSEWMAYILMILGWFILIRSVSDFLKARRHEQLVLQSPDRGLGIPIIAEGESSERVV